MVEMWKPTLAGPVAELVGVTFDGQGRRLVGSSPIGPDGDCGDEHAGREERAAPDHGWPLGGASEHERVTTGSPGSPGIICRKGPQ